MTEAEYPLSTFYKGWGVYPRMRGTVVALLSDAE